MGYAHTFVSRSTSARSGTLHMLINTIRCFCNVSLQVCDRETYKFDSQVDNYVFSS
jgi:hypothetical protein